MNIYPWQSENWKALLSRPDHLPHALLLVGSAGLGKREFAQAMAARLLCEAPACAEGDEGAEVRQACGRCSSCLWLAAGNHPDFRLVQPEEAEDTEAGSEGAAQSAGVGEDASAASDKKSSGKSRATKSTTSKSSARSKVQRTLKIEQIRELSDFVFLGSYRHGRRIVIVQPAEAMTPAAANALLKILEEPPASVCFILVSDAWRQLLPTIRSRCRVVTFARPETAQALAWLKDAGVSEAESLLKLAGGSPLLAQTWAQNSYLDVYRKVIGVLAEKPGDPVQMAAQWSALIKGAEAFDLPQLVEGVQKWLLDLLQLKLTGEIAYHEAWRKPLTALATQAEVTGLLRCHDDLLRIRAVVRHPLNPQLFLEDMAARYVSALRK